MSGGCPTRCTWLELGDGWQQCADVACGIERRDPLIADRAAVECGRKVPQTLSQPISATLGPGTTNDARPTEGNVA